MSIKTVPVGEIKLSDKGQRKDIAYIVKHIEKGMTVVYSADFPAVSVVYADKVFLDSKLFEEEFILPLLFCDGLRIENPDKVVIDDANVPLLVKEEFIGSFDYTLRFKDQFIFGIHTLGMDTKIGHENFEDILIEKNGKVHRCQVIL